MKVYMLLDPHVPMLKGWVGPSSFPRIMSLKVVFKICFGSIKMGVLVPRINAELLRPPVPLVSD